MEKKLIYSVLTGIKQRGKETRKYQFESHETAFLPPRATKFMSTFSVDNCTYVERVRHVSMGYTISK